MTNNKVKIVLEAIYNIKELIHDFFRKSDNSLSDAKLKKLSRIELNSYYDSYRKDKLLKEIYMEFINPFIKYTKEYLNDNSQENYDKFIIFLDHIIDLHNSKENAILNFSKKGIIFLDSLYFNEINDIYYELYGKWLNE